MDTLNILLKSEGLSGAFKLENNVLFNMESDTVVDIIDIENKILKIKENSEKTLILLKAKNEGKLYPDTEYTVSFTKDDAMGMLQVKAAFELGLPDTIIEFSNGTKMPMIAEDFPAFAKWFVIERANFFKG